MAETQDIIVRVLTESELAELNKQLEQAQKELAQMAIDGKEATDEFDKLNQKATSLKATLKQQTQATKELNNAQEKAAESTKKTGEEAQKADGKAVSLKAQLRALKAELQAMADAGDTSSEKFMRMSQEAGNLTDTIGDVNSRVKALSSDTAMLDTGVAAIGVLANAFSAAQSAVGLFAKDNERLQAAVQKSMAAMQLAASVQQIANAFQKESVLMTGLQSAALKTYTWITTAATAQTKALRIAMASTGVGLLVASLGFLVAKLFEYEDAAESAADATDKLAESKKKLDDAYSNINSNIDISILRLKAQGATQKEIDAAQIRGSQEIIKQSGIQMAAYISDRKKEVDDQIKLEAKGDQSLYNSLKYQESITNQRYQARVEATKELYYKIETEKLNAEITISDIEARAEAERMAKSEKNAQERARKLEEWEKMKQQSIRNMLMMDLNGLAKELEMIDQSFEERLQNAQGNEALYNLLLDELRKTRLAKIKEFNDAEVKSQQEKCDAELEAEKALQKSILDLRLKAYEDRKESERANRDLLVSEIKDAREKRTAAYQNELLDLKDAKLKALAAAIESKEYQAANEQDQANILSEISEQYRQKETTASINFSKDMVDIKQQEKEKNLQTQQFYADVLSQSLTGLSQMMDGFGKSSEAQQKKRFEVTKAFNIAITLMDTYLAAQKAYASQMQLTPDSPIRAAIAAGAAVIAGLGRVAAIKKQQFSGSGGGSDSSGGMGNISPSGGSANNNGGLATNPNMTRLDANGRPIIPSGGGQNGNNPQPLRAYVVENDIRSTSRRLNTISQFATLQ